MARMIRRMVVVALVLAGCGNSKSSGSHGTGSGGSSGSPVTGATQTLKECDPTKPLTEAQAKAWFKSTGQTKVSDITIKDDDLDFHEEGQGIYELGAHPCCDIQIGRAS